MRQHAMVMGMSITIDIPQATDKSVFNNVFVLLGQIDSQFSAYKENSEVAQFSQGKIQLSQVSEDLSEIIEGCKKAEEFTDGYFTARFNGNFDPTGYVKGWAIAKAGSEIEKQGFMTYCIGAGGDILAKSSGRKHWRLGIVDPFNPKGLVKGIRLSVTNTALATSGNYERGQHIMNPKTKLPADELASLSVIGPDIVRADILSTAGFAMGAKVLDFIEGFDGYGAVVVLKDKTVALSSEAEKFI